MENSTFIVAEMSANHCGDIKLAKEIIKTAHKIGADAVKLQTYTADTLTIDCDRPEFKVSDPKSLWYGETLYALYQKAYTPWEWQKELKDYAEKEIGIELFSTPFDKTAVDFLETINVQRYKIASFEAIDIPLIEYAASKGKPMIISTGICSKEEIHELITACQKMGNNDITLLKCTSSYPAPLESMNVLTIPDMIQEFGVKAGLSDHSMNIEPVIAAVALGARVLEKHFTLDRALGGADSGFSLNPQEFKEMVQAVRNTEKVLGKISYDINPKERLGARSLYAVKDIKKDEIFTEKNIRSIRPNCGLHPKYYKEILGKTAKQDILRGTPLNWDYIQ